MDGFCASEFSLASFPVDAGMIGALPLHLVEDRDGIRYGTVVLLPAGATLRQMYDCGTITFSVGVGGGADADPASDEWWWVGDPCYVLENNIPGGPGDWTKVLDGVGYHAACVQSFRTVRGGKADSLVFRLANGRHGLVQATAFGDGRYAGRLETVDGKLLSLTIWTGDDESDEEE